MKATILACANLALIKYWGNSFRELNIPINDSISVSLEELQTTTTVEYSKEHQDRLYLNGKLLQGEGHTRFAFVLKHFRQLTGFDLPVRVESTNNFPTAAGIASSASGFGALAHGLYEAAGLQYTTEQVSSLARLGSGSASRTIIPGFAHWHRGADHESSHATQLAAPNDLRILVTITATSAKPISSSLAMLESKQSSPFFAQRGNTANNHIPLLQKAIRDWDFATIGEITQREANNLHAVINTTDMGIYYWNRTTIEIIHAVRQLQEKDIPCYYTMDAGPQVKILVMQEHVEAVKTRLSQIPDIAEIIDTGVGFGSKVIQEHLF